MAFANRLLPLGFMMFSLFLGAGNIIFPPVLGQDAGNHLWIALTGFLLSAVGLPLLGVITVVKVGGGLETMSRDVPKWMSMTMSVAVYLTLGPLFAIPRTTLVSDAFIMQPLTNSTHASIWSTLYLACFLGASLWFALYPGKLIDSVGKLIAPLLVLMLIIIAAGVICDPQGAIHAPQTMPMLTHPFTTGFLSGYQTMDTLCALVFSLVIIHTIQSQGIQAPAQIARYTVQSALLAALGLSFVYWVLSYLGATSLNIAPPSSNGATIIRLYIHQIFGDRGQWLIALAVLLACLTTSIGLLTACGEFFAKQLPKLGYRFCVILITLISFVVTQTGLTALIHITIPTLMVCYPVAITLLVLCLLRQKLSEPRWVFMGTLVPVFFMALIHVLGQAQYTEFAKVDRVLASLPLEMYGLGWILPGLLCGLIVDGSYRMAIKRKTIEL